MKKLTVLALSAGLLSVIGAKISAAEDAPAGLAVSAELEIVSKYVWRGIPLSAAEAYQPSVTLSGYGFAANAWLNYRVDELREHKFSEIDLDLNYKSELRGLSVTPGFVLYTLSYASHYGEAYVKLAYPLAFFKVLMDHYYTALGDGIHGGYYGDAGLGYEKRLANETLWTSSALLGWGNSRFNSFTYDTPDLATRLNVLLLDTSISFKLGDNGSVRPHLTYHVTLPGELRETVQALGAAPNNLVIGVAAGYNF